MATESYEPPRYQIVDANDGREQWLPMYEARSRLSDPSVGAEIGGFVLGSFGPAWEITPSEIQQIRGMDSGDIQPTTEA